MNSTMRGVKLDPGNPLDLHEHSRTTTPIFKTGKAS